MISNISGERKLEVLKLVNYSNWFTNMGNKLKHETLVKVCMQKIGISLLPVKLRVYTIYCEECHLNINLRQQNSIN
jgi:NADPH-dependent 7-cyano-7-deazaguanine reductase QueF